MRILRMAWGSYILSYMGWEGDKCFVHEIFKKLHFKRVQFCFFGGRGKFF